MGDRVNRLIDQIRKDMGPFFVARLCLRVNVRLDTATPDTPASERAIADACMELGYDVIRRERIPVT